MAAQVDRGPTPADEFRADANVADVPRISERDKESPAPDRSTQTNTPSPASRPTVAAKPSMPALKPVRRLHNLDARPRVKRAHGIRSASAVVRIAALCVNLNRRRMVRGHRADAGEEIDSGAVEVH